LAVSLSYTTPPEGQKHTLAAYTPPPPSRSAPAPPTCFSSRSAPPWGARAFQEALSIWGLLAPPRALRAGKPQSGQERPTVSLRRAVDALQRGRVGRVAAGGKVAGRVGSLRTGRRGARRCPCPSCPLHTRRKSPAQSPWAISTGACRAQRSDLALALPPSCPVSGVHWWGDED
jgi:hypothetical protein